MRLNLKLVVINLADAVLLNAAVLGALALRFDGRDPVAVPRVLADARVLLHRCLLLLLNLAGINRSIWRYAGVPRSWCWCGLSPRVRRGSSC